MIGEHEGKDCPTASDERLATLIDRLRLGDVEAGSALRAVLFPGVRWFAARQVGADLVESTVRETLAIVDEQILAGSIRSPQQLKTAVRAILHRNHVPSAPSPSSVPSIPRESIEQANQTRVAAMRSFLLDLPELDREALIRFYCREQGADQICRELKITVSELQALKSEARNRFTELTQYNSSPYLVSVGSRFSSSDNRSIA